MSLDREFLSMMPATVTYSPYSAISTDGYAAPSYGTSKSVRARIQAVRKDVRSATTREIVGSNLKLLMAPWSTAGTSDTVTVTALDKVILPSGFLVAGSCSPPIITAYPVQDESGLHHNEVWL